MVWKMLGQDIRGCLPKGPNPNPLQKYWRLPYPTKMSGSKQHKTLKRYLFYPRDRKLQSIHHNHLLSPSSHLRDNIWEIRRKLLKTVPEEPLNSCYCPKDQNWDEWKCKPADSKKKVIQVKLAWGWECYSPPLCDLGEGNHFTDLCLIFSFKTTGAFRDFSLLDSSLLILIPNSTREDKEKAQPWLEGWTVDSAWEAGSLHPCQKPVAMDSSRLHLALTENYAPSARRRRLSMRAWAWRGGGLCWWGESTPCDRTYRSEPAPRLGPHTWSQFPFEPLSEAHCSHLWKWSTLGVSLEPECPQYVHPLGCAMRM